MSIPVALDRLRAEMARYPTAPYLLTAGADGRPHAVAVTVDWEGDTLVAEVGARTAANVEARALVALLWPPAEAGGFSLIVDGEAHARPAADGRVVVVRPTKGVLHRPAPTPAPATDDRGSACGSDCVPLT
jgi:hypothetical protein